MKRSIAMSAILAAILILPMTANAESDTTALDDERKAIGRALVEINPSNWISLLPNYTEDIEYHDPIVTIEGIEDMTEFLGRLFGAGQSLITTVEDEIYSDDMYAATWTMAGDLGGVPYGAKGMSAVKFRPGETRVYYSRDYYSEGDIMINIPGLAEPTEAFRTYYRCAVDPTFTCPLGPESAPSSKSGIDATSDPGTKLSGLDDERKAIGRALVEINPSNWTSLLPYYTEDIEYHDPIVTIEGIEDMTEFLGRLFASGQTLVTTVEDDIFADDMYAATWTMAGDLDGVPYSAKGMSIVKFRPGETRVYYSRDYYSEGDIMINIPGLDAPTEAFRTYYRSVVDPNFIPEPGILSALSIGCACLLFRRRKP